MVKGRKCQDQLKEIRNTSKHPPDQRLFRYSLAAGASSGRSSRRCEGQQPSRAASHQQRVSWGPDPFAQAEFQPTQHSAHQTNQAPKTSVAVERFANQSAEHCFWSKRAWPSRTLQLFIMPPQSKTILWFERILVFHKRWHLPSNQRTPWQPVRHIHWWQQ